MPVGVPRITARRFLAALSALLAAPTLAGCFAGPSPPEPGPVADPGIPPAAVGEPGLYDLSPDGLVAVEALPGLHVQVAADGSTRYAYDLRQALEPNAHVILLVQALEEQVVTASYDVDIPFEPKIGERPGSDVVCISTEITYDREEQGFYYERAAGRPGVAPEVDEAGGYRGGGGGHGTAGSVDYLVLVFGQRFAHQDVVTFRAEAGDFFRLTNGLSQYPPEATQMDGNHWWQNVTMTAAHRIIRIPSSPLYCLHGFGAFEGGELVGTPPFQVARDRHLEVSTRYGSTVVLNQAQSGAVQHVGAEAPGNRAVVGFHGQRCLAEMGRGVHQDSFEAGTIAIDVEHWAGMPTMLVSGLGRAQAVWSFWSAPAACTPA